MAAVSNSTRDTVNAAASAIAAAAESRAQPPSLPKKRWGSCWSSYWCFGGSHKTSKRIGHAVHIPEPVAPTGPAAPIIPISSTAVVMPFIVPPSSPASLLESGPASAIQSPAPGGPISLTALAASAYSSGGPASMFTIGPYAYETQLVSPPVFSNFTTEPSTACITPHPESVHQTTPSSPEVPFAQLLTSSLNQARDNSGTNQRFALFNYEFQAYQQYPGSPGAQLISPGSVISTSGSSTPFPDRHPLEFHTGEASKFISSEHFAAGKWNSRLGSGSLTPNGAGQGSRLGSGSLTPDGAGRGSRLGSGSLTPDGTGRGSRLGSGSLTPDGAGRGSRLGSGSLTPDGAGRGSRLGSGSLTPGDGQLASQPSSGCLTPDGMGPNLRLGSGSLTPDAAGSTSKDDIFVEKQVSGVSYLANSGNSCQSNATFVDHRVSFEFTVEDVARCLANKSGSLLRNMSQSSQPVEDPAGRERFPKESNGCDVCSGKSADDKPDNAPREAEELCCQKDLSFNSSKEFNFDNRKGGVSDDAASGSEWWTDKKVFGKEGRSSNSWAFFPMLQPENN